MMVRTAPSPPHYAQLDAGTIALVIGGAVAVVTAFVSGLWQWIGGRKKSSTDMQASLVAGFVALLGKVQEERDRLLTRIDECEANGQRQDRRINKLERTMARHKIEIPEDET